MRYYFLKEIRATIIELKYIIYIKLGNIILWDIIF